MINLLNGNAEDLNSVSSGEALEQGMFVYDDDFDATSGELEVLKVDSDAIAKYDRNKLYLVFQNPIDIEGADSTHEDIAINTMCIKVGHVPGLQVEDSDLAANSTTAAWASASYGDLLVLNTSGFLTITGAGDAGSGRTSVAKFLRYLNGVVFYELV